MKSRIKVFFRKIARAIFVVLVMFFVSSFGYALYLKWFPPITTPLMVKRAFQNENPEIKFQSRWVGMDRISDYLKVAVIASEDQRFAEHFGIDLYAINKAIKKNKRSKRTLGASTISQQVAKNVFLWPNRTWLRKGLEVYFTLLIETLWSKERILQMYLNVAELGVHTFGVEAASQRYLRKPASRLTAGEAALIAAVLPNPRKYSIKSPSGYVLRRKARILRFMKMIGGKSYLEKI